MDSEAELTIVKIGSAVTRAESGGLDTDALARLVEQMATLHAEGRAVCLVSSGAVAAGRDVLGAAPPARRSEIIADRQVCAAVGQIELMAFYRKAFAKHGIEVAQVLATRSDFASRRHYLNMRQCVSALLARGILPIINENDVVSVSELMFTDNDELAGLLAAMLAADRLMLLTNVDGVFDGPPDAAGSRIISDWSKAGSKPRLEPAGSSDFGRGGIQTKIRNAEKLAALGTEVWIANGRRPDVVTQAQTGAAVGTRFPRSDRRASGHRRWIAGAPKKEQAGVVINDGAEAVLRSPDRLASLLPVGVVSVEGEFQRGDVVPIMNAALEVVAYGRAEQSSETVRAHVGQRNRRPVVHYDYLFVLESS
ncbi:MAG: glutamate 5-kinase [Pseudomonadota bacterium]